MKVVVVDSETIEIEPEGVAEVDLLRRFSGGRVAIREARPFDPNVPRLEVKPKEVK